MHISAILDTILLFDEYDLSPTTLWENFLLKSKLGTVFIFTPSRLSRYEICLRYVLSNPYIDKVLIGTDNFSQLKKLVNISKKGNINIKYKDINPSYDINLLNPSKWPGLI